MPRAKKSSGGGRKRVASKPAKKRRHGGHRAGAGRKREKLPDEVINRLGACPDKPNAIRVWNARLLAEVQVLSMKGKIGVDLAASLRANAGAIERALPPAPRPRDLDDDDPDDDEDTGPEPVESAGDDGLRVQ